MKQYSVKHVNPCPLDPGDPGKTQFDSTVDCYFVMSLIGHSLNTAVTI